ncbi:hypothetical protein [Streptomyces avicenniae]|nr:hypothetical protein [Streptomyces avicenniae]
MQDDDGAPFVNDTPEYVVSWRPEKPEWKNSTSSSTRRLSAAPARPAEG